MYESTTAKKAKTLMAVIAVASVSVFTCQPASAGSLTQSVYGKLSTGETVSAYTLTNKKGITVKFISFGGVITEVDTPDRDGKMADIVLGLPSMADYEKNARMHFGALIGRYANRIAAGRFTLDGRTYQLPINNGPNTLHGGPDTFAARVWQVKPIKVEGGVGAELTYISADGENGFPGKVITHVRYILKDDNEFDIDYRATTDKKTVINLTNHTFFNLAGEGSGSVDKQELEIAASRYTVTDENGIPTGELATVADTPMDFRLSTPIGKNLRTNFPQLLWAHGYDHNWVLDNGGHAKPDFAARAYDPASGRVLEVYTTQPGLQFYTANGHNGSVSGPSGRIYRQGDSFALETQHFPDSPNHSEFPSTVLEPGKTFHELTVWKFLTK
ncbi:aldose epimerase family protein [Paraburkholderia sp.]|uniref:aldose epimerase family protein n=1 Tax=Paraburkholderia sp. TaxID=1926495 RepID=UPI0039C94DD6